MTPKPIPEGDRLVRHVKKRQLVRDPDDGSVVLGVMADAFRLRDGEDSLSSAWAEFYPGEGSVPVEAAVAHFAAHVLTVKPSDRFAVGQVSTIKAACAVYGHQVRIVSEPEENHEAHASVRRYRDDDIGLLELLASEAWAELVAA